MSDVKTRLAATLAELHEELSATSAADSDVRKLLSQALAEIQAKLAAAAEAEISTTERPAAERDGLTDRLRTAAIHFEESHPTLAGLINSVTETLAQLGI